MLLSVPSRMSGDKRAVQPRRRNGPESSLVPCPELTGMLLVTISLPGSQVSCRADAPCMLAAHPQFAAGWGGPRRGSTTSDDARPSFGVLAALFEACQLFQFQSVEKRIYREIDGLGGCVQDGEVLPCQGDNKSVAASGPLRSTRPATKSVMRPVGCPGSSASSAAIRVMMTAARPA